MAYDDDDGAFLFAQGNHLAGSSPGISLPSSDTSPYITAIAYSHAAHAIYFSGFTTLYRATLAGAVTTVAGGFSKIESIAADSSGTPYVIDDDHISTVTNGVARSLTPPGTVTNPMGTTLASPQMAYDSTDGALYVTDPLGDVVKRVSTTGSVSPVAGSCLTYYAGGQKSCFEGQKPGTGAAARFSMPSGIAYDAAHDVLYVSDQLDNDVWSVTPAGNATIFAGYGYYGAVNGNGRLALMFDPVNLAFSSTRGQVYVNQIDPFTGISTIDTVATSGSPQPVITFPAVQFDAPAAPALPQALAGAPDGSAWVTEAFSNAVDHLTPSGITEFKLPAGVINPFYIAVDPNGDAWATADVSQGAGIASGHAIVRMRADGTETTYVIDNSFLPEIDGIAIGADGNPWFGYFIFGNPAVASIKTIDRTTGTIATYPIGNVKVRALAAGPDGNVWFVTFPNNTWQINRMSTAGQTVGTPFTVSRSILAMAPNAVDHSEWYVDGAIMLGRVDVSGAETTFPLCSSCGAQPEPSTLAVAPDGSIRFTEENPAHLVHRDTSGSTTRYLLPAFNGAPNGVAVRADGKVWVSMGVGVTTGFLFDPAAYDALHLPHGVANAAARRAPRALDLRALFGRPSRSRPKR